MGEELLKARRREIYGNLNEEVVCFDESANVHKTVTVYVMFTVHTSNSRYYIHDLFRVMESVPRNLRAA